MALIEFAQAILVSVLVLQSGSPWKNHAGGQSQHAIPLGSAQQVVMLWNEVHQSTEVLVCRY